MKAPTPTKEVMSVGKVDQEVITLRRGPGRPRKIKMEKVVLKIKERRGPGRPRKGEIVSKPQAKKEGMRVPYTGPRTMGRGKAIEMFNSTKNLGNDDRPGRNGGGRSSARKEFADKLGNRTRRVAGVGVLNLNMLRESKRTRR